MPEWRVERSPHGVPAFGVRRPAERPLCVVLDRGDAPSRIARNEDGAFGIHGDAYGDIETIARGFKWVFGTNPAEQIRVVVEEVRDSGKQ